MTALDRALDWNEESPGTFSGSIDGSWYQGRGVFGGLVLALLARSMDRAIAARERGRLLRSVTVQFCAPMPDTPGRVRVRTLREGGRVTFVAASLEHGDALVAEATAVFAAPRRSPVAWVEDAFPEVPPVDAVSPVPEGLPGLPDFCQHVEYRYAWGEAPFSGASRAALGGWSRLREERPVDVAWILATLDAWPPPACTRATAPAGAATLTLSCELLPDASRLEGEPWRHTLFTSSATVAADGYAHERARLWTPDGRLLARATQVRALLLPG